MGVWESNGPVAKAADVAVYKYAAATAVLGISTRELSALIGSQSEPASPASSCAVVIIAMAREEELKVPELAQRTRPLIHCLCSCVVLHWLTWLRGIVVQRIDLKVNVSCCDGCRRKVMKAMSLKGQDR